jgi:hypothetical protein
MSGSFHALGEGELQMGSATAPDPYNDPIPRPVCRYVRRAARNTSSRQIWRLCANPACRKPFQVMTSEVAPSVRCCSPACAEADANAARTSVTMSFG